MWCSDCQQDVPAVARVADDSLVCPRCREQLCGVTAPSDEGIALDSYDAVEVDDMSPPVDWFEQVESRQRLQEIGRKLRVGTASLPKGSTGWSPWAEPPMLGPEIQLRSVGRRAAADGHGRQTPTWFSSFLIGGGVLGFCVGVGLLAWAAAFGLPKLWLSGMTLTLCAEGLLIISLTWVAARLWRNGRRVNRQLDGVDRQLGEMKDMAGTLASGQMSASQQYYHHFAQSTSPRMLVSNLRGQVDQLAARISAEG